MRRIFESVFVFGGALIMAALIFGACNEFTSQVVR